MIIVFNDTIVVPVVHWVITAPTNASKRYYTTVLCLKCYRVLLINILYDSVNTPKWSPSGPLERDGVYGH